MSKTLTPEEHLDFLAGHHYHQVYGDGSDGADHIEPIRAALRAALRPALEPCRLCGSTDRWLHYWGCGRYYGGSHLGMKP